MFINIFLGASGADEWGQRALFGTNMARGLGHMGSNLGHPQHCLIWSLLALDVNSENVKLSLLAIIFTVFSNKSAASNLIYFSLEKELNYEHKSYSCTLSLV